MEILVNDWKTKLGFKMKASYDEQTEMDEVGYGLKTCRGRRAKRG